MEVCDREHLVELDAIDQCEWESPKQQAPNIFGVGWPAERRFAQAVDAAIQFRIECRRRYCAAICIPLPGSRSLLNCVWMKKDLHRVLPDDLGTGVFPANRLSGTVIELGDAALDLRRPSSFCVRVDRAV